MKQRKKLREQLRDTMHRERGPTMYIYFTGVYEENGELPARDI